MGLKRRFCDINSNHSDEIFNIEERMPEQNPRKIKANSKQKVNHSFMPNLKSNIEIPY